MNYPTRDTRWLKLGAASAITIIVAFVVGAGETKYAVGGDLAAVTEALLDKAFDYKAKNDLKGLKRLREAYLVTDLKKDQEVEVLKAEADSGKVKIRIVGAKVLLWTSASALKTRKTSVKLPQADGKNAKKAQEEEGEGDWGDEE